MTTGQGDARENEADDLGEPAMTMMIRWWFPPPPQVMIPSRVSMLLLVLGPLFTLIPCLGLSSLRSASSSSSFFGVSPLGISCWMDYGVSSDLYGYNRRSIMVMRKQKASDRRTRRRQRGEVGDSEETARLSLDHLPQTLTRSPMQGKEWHQRRTPVPETPLSKSSALEADSLLPSTASTGGRGRSRKRSQLYQALSQYHNSFLQALTAEYSAEEDEVLGRIKASLDDPLGLEAAGYALYDLYPERRGNLFSDEVYRLTKASDATTTYGPPLLSDLDPVADVVDQDLDPESYADDNVGQASKSLRTRPRKRMGAPSQDSRSHLPPNHKFSNNDVILLTLQPDGSGDFFSSDTMPTSETAVSVEARVLNLGPTYLDIAVPPGLFAAAFGPAPNDWSHQQSSGGQYPDKNRNCRLRADRFFSNVPYQRMVSALTTLTNVPQKSASKPNKHGADTSGTGPESHGGDADGDEPVTPSHKNICMDEVIREAILSTHVLTDPESSHLGVPGACNLQELGNKLSKSPMANSPILANQVVKYIKSNPHGIFQEFNAPQIASIRAALTRRLTLIQGPPGSGKTTVAGAITFGFVHQCRAVSVHTKVLACAFSNVGADNLAEAILRLGLKVVRIGKPSAVSESLWNYTLDAAIDRDPDAQKSLEEAAEATARLAMLNQRRRRSSESGSNAHERALREAATTAVRASIQACNIAATRSMREADVIVSTSTGAADPRLMAACGIVSIETETEKQQLGIQESSKTLNSFHAERELAPDGLPPLSTPFVLIDEACQSVEPASLVPIVSSNSCRSLVLLGDPCQLPPTVKSREAGVLSLSLMERLAANLPPPIVASDVDSSIPDTTFLDSAAIKQAKSVIRSNGSSQSYRRRFAGSLLLSIQYRMHPSIAAFPSAIFYDGLLSTPRFLAGKRPFPAFLRRMMPCGSSDFSVRLLDIGGRGNERQGLPSRFAVARAESLLATEDRTTYWNEMEAERVTSLVREILEASDPGIQSIGIITPYSGQVQLIKSLMDNDSSIQLLSKASRVSIEIKSVDGYQGRERDIIIFSAVRSNRQNSIGFLHDWRRMNVALTRAKSGLFILGDLGTLADADKHWAALLKWAETVRCVVDEYDAPDDEPTH